MEDSQKTRRRMGARRKGRSARDEEQVDGSEESCRTMGRLDREGEGCRGGPAGGLETGILVLVV